MRERGDVNNVVFPSGACVIDELFLYYGGADRVCCLATANLDSLVKVCIRGELIVEVMSGN